MSCGHWECEWGFCHATNRFATIANRPDGSDHYVNSVPTLYAPEYDASTCGDPIRGHDPSTGDQSSTDADFVAKQPPVHKFARDRRRRKHLSEHRNGVKSQPNKQKIYKVTPLRKKKARTRRRSRRVSYVESERKVSPDVDHEPECEPSITEELRITSSTPEQQRKEKVCFSDLNWKCVSCGASNCRKRKYCWACTCCATYKPHIVPKPPAPSPRTLSESSISRLKYRTLPRSHIPPTKCEVTGAFNPVSGPATEVGIWQPSAGICSS